ncbi:MAG TPA: SDR family oxidoreductase [Terriglobales bacterium]|nr:SDR family oxidoreductase [Terriglobales bacterium]
MTQARIPQAPELYSLGDRVALVTGGSGIYGAHIVSALAESGAHVVVASRNREKCQKFAAKLCASGLQVEATELDLTSEASIQKVRDEIVIKFGRIDVLVNNAVARAGGDLHNTTAAEWEETMRVNSTGLFQACKVFSGPMQERRSGSILNIASIYGMVGPDFSIYEGTSLTSPVAYSFAKGGMINLTRYLASYLAPFNVRVNCLSPGGMQTEDTPIEFVPQYSRRTPMSRMAEPADIKGPVVFFASEASRYITGQNLAVDGGWTAI